nr:citrate/2-methylcitrate synthase [uncultured Eubacterium sp.]
MPNIRKHVDEEKIMPQISKYADRCITNSCIDPTLYDKYNVKSGLREKGGQGVLTGLTEIGDVHSFNIVDGKPVPCEGRLFYRGIDINDIVNGFIKENRFGFEEVTYLLLFGELPTARRLENFNKVIAEYRTLPATFVRDIIMKAPSSDMMNQLARCVLSLYSWDDNPDDTSIPNVVRQCISLISRVPLISVYSYHAMRHYHYGDDLHIINPDPNLSTAENILRLLRPNSTYTKLEAKILDLALVLHAEHGGGNNSTFTTHVVSSSGTDTYSAIAASLGSLKGPRHGGANVKVKRMFDNMKEAVNDWNDDEEIKKYLRGILDKRLYDKSGLIYGIGHAVYAISDPRAILLKQFTEKLAVEKGRTDELALYKNVERLAPDVISKAHKRKKVVSANVDFYSGFVYSMLGLPDELYTPLFAAARMSGWSAHRIEEIINAGKIIRPAYKNVAEPTKYVPLSKRRKS